MNADQHQIVLREAGFRCAVCWLSYDAARYYGLAESLHPLSRLTIDHLDGRQRVKRQKVDEEWSNLWVLCGACHYAKDNGSQSAQLQHLRRVLADVRSHEEESARVRHIEAVLDECERRELTFREFGRSFIAARGLEPSDYEVAKLREYTVDDPARRVRRKQSLRADYKRAVGKKLYRLRFFLRQHKKTRERPLPNIRLPEKVVRQRERPVLNGRRDLEVEEGAG